MRFIVMVKATAESEAGIMPNEKLLADMGKFNEELVKAGVMLAGEGLQPRERGTSSELVLSLTPFDNAPTDGGPSICHGCNSGRIPANRDRCDRRKL